MRICIESPDPTDAQDLRGVFDGSLYFQEYDKTVIDSATEPRSRLKA